MWISKKKYNELIEQKEDFERIASETIQLNGRVIDSNKRMLEEMKDIQNLNYSIQQRNEELLARCEELERERDMWRERAEEENRQAEIYRGMLKSAEVG